MDHEISRNGNIIIIKLNINNLHEYPVYVQKGIKFFVPEDELTFLEELTSDSKSIRRKAIKILAKSTNDNWVRHIIDEEDILYFMSIVESQLSFEMAIRVIHNNWGTLRLIEDGYFKSGEIILENIINNQLRIPNWKNQFGVYDIISELKIHLRWHILLKRTPNPDFGYITKSFAQNLHGNHEEAERIWQTGKSNSDIYWEQRFEEFKSLGESIIANYVVID